MRAHRRAHPRRRRHRLTFPGDLTDAAYCRDLVAKTVDGLGGLDILVNNGGKQIFNEDLATLSDEQFDATFKTNVYAMFWITKAALAHLAPGRDHQHDLHPGVQALGCARRLRIDEGHDQCVHEGARPAGRTARHPRQRRARADLDRAAAHRRPAAGKLEHFGEDTPLGRMGQPAELAPAYVFLASAESSYVIGETLNVNGGIPSP
jgi:NAD(P)-dependent dehydrogenase (short-subunit alcohol dehydrogenase family)